MRIVPRAEWGFTGWKTTPATVPLGSRTAFLVHYEGANPCGNQTGPGVPRSIHGFHKNSRGWAGIGYNFIVTQKGEIFEGRGWTYAGAHCTGWNTSGIGVQIHVGGDEQPSQEALAATKWLYDEACRRTGKTLRKMGHRDGFATECPGRHLTAWVRAGMPAALAARVAPQWKLDGLQVDGRLATEDAAEIQMWLNEIRRPVRYWPTLLVDGEIGEQTIRALQASAGMAPEDVDGALGKKTIEALEVAYSAKRTGSTGWTGTLVRALQRAVNAHVISKRPTPTPTPLSKPTPAPVVDAPTPLPPPGTPGSALSEAVPPLLEWILTHSTAHNVPPELAAAICKAESGLNPNVGYARGTEDRPEPDRAYGPMQIKQVVAEQVGITDRKNPELNVLGGIKYLAWLRSRFATTPQVIAAYHDGPTVVTRLGAAGSEAGRAYVAKVTSDPGVASLIAKELG